MNWLFKIIKNFQKIVSCFFNLILFLFLLPFLFFGGAFKKNRNGIPYFRGMNTAYEVECPDCGYTYQYMIGCAHTFDEPRVGFSSDLGYCPKCREPIFRSSHPQNKRGYVCSSCGTETKEYKIGSKVKLRCPHCYSNKLKVTDLERPWMT